ncbi:hypothetical protein [Phenylobacterium sp.]|uniref:hypothetical protein n=1 Tax=Phenylobacterium sp. TaxID=1871053 RepID=UPI002F3ED7F6
MISCKLEQVDGRLALVLDDDAVETLGARVGDTLHLELSSDGVLLIAERQTWIEDNHARGRAFLRRYRRTFEQLS